MLSNFLSGIRKSCNSLGGNETKAWIAFVVSIEDQTSRQDLRKLFLPSKIPSEQYYWQATMGAGG